MSRYRKSIHQTLEEVGEWQPPTEPEVLVEEAPIPTETGRKLLKNRIAHQKVEKKELKYYPMGDVFRGRLQKTTQYLKEALELDDELVEAVKWEVKVSGLPVFYSDGKSKGAVRQMLRKLLKHPDDIQSITRTTSAELKKIRRGQIAGDEPGDEDEDKNPVGPSYNEATLPPHLSKFVDKKGNLTPDAAKRVAAGRKKDKPKYKIVDRTPKGYGPNEEDEMAIMSLDHKEPPRKLKNTQQGLEAFKQSRDEVELDELSPELANRAYRGARKKRQQIFNKSDETDRIPNVKKQDRQAKKFTAYAAKKEDVELDEAGRPRGAAHIENTRFWDLKDKELHYIIKDAGKAIQANPTAKKATQGPGNWSDQVNDAATVLYYRKNKKIKVEAFEGPFTAPGSGSIAKPRKAKASDANKSIEQQVADARKESVAFQEDEWSTMWKNAAKEKPKMSFKQATEVVDEVGLDKKEKIDALKTAKKWLKT